MLYEFEVGYHAAKATKNICGPKGKDVVDHYVVSR